MARKSSVKKTVIEDILGGKSLHDYLNDFSNGLHSGNPTSSGVRSPLDPSVNADPLNGGVGSSGVNSLLGSNDDTAQGVGAALASLGSGKSFADSLAAYIQQNDWITSEEQAAFFQALIQYLNTIDQRLYDQQLTEDQRRYNRDLQLDQRVYDSPTNQLARLMGAGISRDAAIQLLSGAAGGSGVGGAAGAGMVTQSAPTTPLPEAAGGRIIQGIAAFTDLVRCGVDVARAAMQVQLMQSQSYMSRQDMQSYQASASVTQMIDELQMNGVLSKADFDSWTNLSDFEKWVYDHADTKGVKPYFDNGSIRGAFGTPFGRNHLNNYWDNVIKGRSSGTQTVQFLRSQALKNDIDSISSKQAQRDYYVSLNTALNEIIKSDEEIAQLWQDLVSGNIGIQIAGYDLDISKERHDAFMNSLDESVVVNGNTVSGRDMLSYAHFGDMFEHFVSALTVSDNGKYAPPTYWKDSKGVEHYGSNKDRFIAYLRENQDAALTAAFIQTLVKQNRLDKYGNSWAAPIYKFFDMMHNSGGDDFVKTGASAVGTAANVAIPFMLP